MIEEYIWKCIACGRVCVDSKGNIKIPDFLTRCICGFTNYKKYRISELEK